MGLQCDCECQIFTINDSRDKFTCVSCKKEYFSEAPIPPKPVDVKESKKKVEEEFEGKAEKVNLETPGTPAWPNDVSEMSEPEQSSPIDFEPETEDDESKE